MTGATMARKRKRKTEKTPQPRAFVARPCTACVTRREPNTNYSRVYSKHGRMRYCKCDFCGHTWTQTISADQIATTVAKAERKSIAKQQSQPKDTGHGNSSITTKSNRRRD